MKLRRAPVITMALIIVIALAAPLLPIADAIHMDVAHRMAPPSWPHPLGLDELGRDELARILWGGRASLVVAFTASLIAGLCGTIIGVMGGFLRGIVEQLLLRGVDVVLCFPPLLLALLVVTLLGPGTRTLILVLSVLFVPGFARVAYAGTLTVRTLSFVEAVQSLGASPLRIMIRTISPNIAGPVLVQFSLTAASAIVLESGLSFLGLRVVPPTPSWGLAIGAARATMGQAPLLLLWPSLALTVTILAMNALCDALRDAFEPHAASRSVARHLHEALLPPRAIPASDRLLEIRDLTIAIETPSGGTALPVRALSLSIDPGETLAIVGESGSGKTLTGLSILGLLPDAARIASGALSFQGSDLRRLDEAGWRHLRGGDVAMVFQDPMSSLNPLHRVGAQLAEAMTAHRRASAREVGERAVALLQQVGIPDAARRATAFPHEMSGGMRQRAMIAMAIANNPRLIVADEPTASLDVTIQAQVLDLLAALKQRSNLALIFISHSLPVVAEIADRVAVMYAGEIVEEGPAPLVFATPRHPYTTALLASTPREQGKPPPAIGGVVPPPDDMTQGCRFAARCPHCLDPCSTRPARLIEVAAGWRSRCWRWAET
ncbi:MAG: dipeptide/oligopeptide/nickel ABC transporter permease/ATP-binding protein [Alphaproteobacteria bacterium]|nr:dipeptide/oligopeptide/nickel ABC transporter permease/ATP-binding protein [Alphaproteobacteria bacterium]